MFVCEHISTCGLSGGFFLFLVLWWRQRSLAQRTEIYLILVVKSYQSAGGSSSNG